MSSPEQAIISAVLRSGDMQTAVRYGITSSMFHVFSKEWEFIERHYARHRKAPEKTAFRHAFRDFPILKVDDVETYVEPLRTEYARNAINVLLDETVSQVDAGKDPVVVLAGIEKDVRTINATASVDSTVNVIGEWTDTYESVVGRSERQEKHGFTGVPTGFKTLDRITGGVQPGELWMLGARLGQGKTWGLTAMATAALQADYNVHIESLEQPRHQITTRVHTFLSKGIFKHSDLSHGKVNLTEYQEWLQELASTTSGVLNITDATRGRTTVATIAGHCERSRPDLLLVDYVTLIKSPGKDWQALAEVSSDLKQVATTYGVGIVAAAQLNREAGMRGLPGPEALAQSDSFGMDADAVITMRKDRDSDRVMDMMLSKYRHGADNVQWKARFEPNIGVFTEISDDQAQALCDAEDDG